MPNLALVPKLVGFVQVRDDRVMPFRDEGAKPLGKPPTYPWRTVDVGHSFNMLPHVGKGSARVQTSQANRELAPKHFKVRKYGDEGYVVWRVE